MTRILLSLGLTLGLFCAGSAPAHAQSDEMVEDPDDARRVAAWLEYNADSSENTQIAVLRTAAGALSIGAGMYELMADRGEQIALREVTGWFALSVGALSLSLGLRDLIWPFDGASRFERWQHATRNGVTDRIVGEFVGELRADARAAWRARMFQRVAGALGFALGLGVVVQTGIAGAEEERAPHFVMGSAIGALGLLTMLTSLIVSREEVVWSEYNDGFRPDLIAGEASPTISLSPLVGLHGELGVSAAGTF